MAERIARLLQHGLLPREEAEELVATLKGLKCAPISERCGWVAPLKSACLRKHARPIACHTTLGAQPAVGG